MAQSEILNELVEVIRQRVKDRPDGSYVAGLVTQGLPAVRAKIDEESKELIEASEQKDRNDIIWEGADLLFHMLVLLAAHGIPFDEILQALKKRRR